jgi:2'-5' RNA ligase
VIRGARWGTPRGGGHRLFFALWPDPATRTAIAHAAATLDGAATGQRTPADRYHLTVSFLGDVTVAPETVARVATAVAASLRTGPFELVLDRAAGFPGSGVWWVGPAITPPGLHALHEALGDALAAARIPTQPHSTFVPHVTVRQQMDRSLAPSSIAPVHWSVRDFALVESFPGTDAPYRMLRSWPLLVR